MKGITMTDTTTTDTTESTIEQQDADEVQATDTTIEQEQEPEQEPSKAGREAAKYRRQLRDTEQLLEATQAKVAQLQNVAIDMILSQKVAIPSPYTMGERNVQLEKPSDLFELGYAKVEDCFNEDGSINHDHIRAAVNTMYTERPRLFAGSNYVSPFEGKTPHERFAGLDRDSFADAFAPPKND